jgi:hypothetical protein
MDRGTGCSPELAHREFAFPHQIGAGLLLVVSAYFACSALCRGPGIRYWWGRLARLLPAFGASLLFTWMILRYVAPVDWGIPDRRDLVRNCRSVTLVVPVGARYPFASTSPDRGPRAAGEALHIVRRHMYGRAVLYNEAYSEPSL